MYYYLGISTNVVAGGQMADKATSKRIADVCRPASGVCIARTARGSMPKRKLASSQEATGSASSSQEEVCLHQEAIDAPQASSAILVISILRTLVQSPLRKLAWKAFGPVSVQ